MKLCILGVVGDCGTTAEANVKIQNETLNRDVSKVFLKQLQDHRAEGHIVQRVTGKTRTGNVVIRDVNLENMVNITLSSWQKMQNEEEFKKTLSTAIDNLVDVAMKATSGFLSGPVEARYKGELQNIIKNEIETDLTMEQVNSCLASVYVEQVVEGETETGDVLMTGINITNTATVAADCVADQMSKIIQQSDTLNKVVTEMNAEIEAESKGPFESFFGSTAGVITFILILLALGVGAVVVGIVIFNYMKKGASQSIKIVTA